MRSAAALALLSALHLVKASPVAAPTPEDSLAEAYGEVAAQIKPPVKVPSNGNVLVSIVSYNPSTVISAAIADATTGGISRKRDTIDDLIKRGPCDPYPPGGGPAVTTPSDSDTSFLKYQPFADAANNAAGLALNGYNLASGFKDLSSSVTAGSYLGYNGSFTSYDVQSCATQCDSISGCVSFNMFYERNPTVDANDQQCPNPPSLTRIKCSFWGVPVTTNDAINNGQYQSQFHVVMTGSNAWTSVPDVPAGYGNMQFASTGAIQSPGADNSYMGVQTFPNTAYDPQVCADACVATNNWNAAHPDAQTASRNCSFFDAYMLYKNQANPVFTCTYYTQPYDKSYATNVGQWDSQNNHYTIGHSYLFTLNSS